jgi:predicted Zn-dependent protease
LFSKKKSSRPRPPRTARPALEALESRLVPYALSGNAWPVPQLITIGFVPDGTSLAGGYTSNLFATFNAKFGSASAWENQILRAAQQWAQQTNVNFAVVGDNGAPIGSGSYEQGDPNMADIRIGGYNFGTTALAQAYMPPPANNTSYAGDMQFNTGKSFAIPGVSGSYDLFTVAMHELGHALGLYHSSVFSAAMYSSYTAAKTGLVSDDISGIRSIYSGGAARSADSLDATAGNTSFATAADLSSYLDPTNLSGMVNSLDITTAGMTRFYAVTAPAQPTSNTTSPTTSMSTTTTSTSSSQLSGSLVVQVQSSGFSLLAPKVTVYAADQVTVLGTGSVTGYSGGMVTVNVTGVSPGQVFYIAVQGCDNTALGTGAFALGLNFGTSAMPVATPPNTQTLAGAVPTIGGGQAVALEPVFQVNSVPTGDPLSTGVAAGNTAMDANGNYVAVWASQGPDGSGWGVFGQRYNAQGTPVGGPFQVNTYTCGDQKYPAVAVAPGGAFVVTWSSYGEDGCGWGVYAQRYNADGTRAGGEFRVNTSTSGDQEYSAVAMDNAGDFAVTWSNNQGSSWGVRAQWYNASGTPSGGELQVNTYTPDDQNHSAVAMDNAGDFVITWQSHGQDGSGWGVYGQRFYAGGAYNGGEFRVNTYTAGDQMSPAVAMNRTTGDFVVVWQSYGESAAGMWSIYGQRYNLQGVAQGGEFRANSSTSYSMEAPSVAMDGSGNFLVAWVGYDAFGNSQGVLGQQFNATGATVGTQFTANTTTSNQQSASVALDSQGDAVIVWSGTASGSSTTGVFGECLPLNDPTC